ncbi:MAG: energy-coupling factor transporter transmembrane protein EcfT [Clostridia bacterium]|nr:energy-coupling factor transporter transmembrane protein EcfT [Clostridia bacterium]MBQ4249435.1 energy-coupling factor transporter transmembrane protein EcfT [Clostridia bacterium]
MLKDITLGQFFPGTSPIHRLDPRTKLLLALIFIVVLFIINSLIAYIILGVLLAVVVKVSEIPLGLVLKGLKPIFVIVIITAVLNIFYNPNGEVLWEWGILRVTTDGIMMGVFMAIRIVYLIIGVAIILTYTTSPILLTDAVESVFSPFKRFGFPAHEIAMMMTIAIRFIPTLVEETEKIINAQKARGADFETGSLLKRAKALVPILVPLFVSAFKRADELATAMECRCYHGGENRTRMRVLKTTSLDYIAVVITVIVCAGLIAFNFIDIGWRL